MSGKKIAKDVLLAAEIAVFYVSSVFLSKIITDAFGLAAAFIYILFISALYGLALISDDKIEWLVKWGLSIPISRLVLQYFISADYSVRALNWLFPNYGRETAGGNFTGFFLIVMLSVNCLIAAFIALVTDREKHQTAKRSQLIVTSFFAAVIIAVVLILESMFPSYEHISAHM